jgi:large subunit ribosomal protein L37Ae
VSRDGVGLHGTVSGHTVGGPGPVEKPRGVGVTAGPGDSDTRPGKLAGFICLLGRYTSTVSDQESKVGSAGRFGARYGRVARRRVAQIEREMRSATVDGDSVKRVGTGIWVNEETGEKFAGGAYKPETPAGKTVNRSIRAALGEDEE